MKRIKLIFIISFYLLSSSLFCQDDLTSKPLIRNYSFNIELDIVHLQRNNDFKYIINGGMIKNEITNKKEYLKGRNLYKINYQYKPSKGEGFDKYIRTPIDTTIISLSSQQLDSLFYLTQKLFVFSDQNIETGSEYEIYAYESYDGEVAKITFDLGEIGEAYVAHVKKADKISPNLSYLRLLNYIEKIE